MLHLFFSMVCLDVTKDNVQNARIYGHCLILALRHSRQYFVNIRGSMKMWSLLEYEKILLLICIHHFDSDVINNMDHMRISGT